MLGIATELDPAEIELRDKIGSGAVSPTPSSYPPWLLGLTCSNEGATLAFVSAQTAVGVVFHLWNRHTNLCLSPRVRTYTVSPPALVQMGDVYEASWQGKIVAAKTIKGASSGPLDKKSKLYKEVITELQVMSSVGSHPNIVTFFGAVTLSKPLIVMELIKGPTLESFLHEREGHSRSLKKATIAGWSRDLLRGVSHLHDRDPIIIHRDCESWCLMSACVVKCVCAG